MRMAEHSELHAFVGHENPTIVAHARGSGGGHALGDVCDPRGGRRVRARARDRHRDGQRRRAARRRRRRRAARRRARARSGPTRAGAEIEWNKAFARVAARRGRAGGRRRALRVVHDAARARGGDGVLRRARPSRSSPSGLTGGKGVKVMGPHLADHEEAARLRARAARTRRRGESVLIEEKVIGAEFTIQAISDGRTVVFPPSTYDYPYRYDGDEGPGTGGMGSLSMPEATLPFMTRRPLRAGVRDHRARDRAPRRRRPPLQRRHEQRLLRDRRGRQGDRVQRPLRRPRVHEHHEPVRRQLAGGDASGSASGALERERRAAARARPRSCCTSSRPTTRCARARRTSSRSTASASKPTAATCSSPRPSPAGEDRYRTVGTSRAVALATHRAHARAGARARGRGAPRPCPVLEWRADVGDERYLQGCEARRPRCRRARAEHSAAPAGCARMAR